jgi:flagellar biosynthesis protein FlhG
MSMTNAHGRPVQVIGVSGGKGGVGKSNVAVNLAVSLAERDHRVILLDADLGLANLDVLLGIKPRQTLEDVLAGRCTLDEVLVEGPAGVKVVPAGSGVAHMTRLSAAEQGGLIQAFSELRHPVDFLLIDTAAGIGQGVAAFLAAAQHVLLVVCDEPTSITDAYALLKVLHQQHDIDRFAVLANMVRDRADGEQLFAKLQRVTDRFLDVQLSFAGAIPFDDNLRRAVKRQRALVDLYPSSKAALAFKRLAIEVEGWPMPMLPRGHLEFFAERLVQRGFAG